MRHDLPRLLAKADAAQAAHDRLAAAQAIKRIYAALDDLNDDPAG